MIDLHCHSTVSDGALEPEQVVALAAQNGCSLLALTDHDHLGGIARARAAAQTHGIRLVSGVEISVSWQGRTLHIVGLDFDETDADLNALLARVRSGRIERMREMAAKLQRRGIHGVFEGAMALAAANPDMVSRTHLADFLVQQGHAASKQQAFTRYIGEGKPGYVRHQWAELEEAVSTVKAAGGLTVIAHPMRYQLSATAKRRLCETFVALGGNGIEVHSGRSDANDRANYTLLANRFGLLASCGSDFHRPHDYSGGTLGACPELPTNCTPIWQAFRLPCVRNL